MQENVRQVVIRANEPVAFRRIEPLDRSCDFKDVGCDFLIAWDIVFLTRRLFRPHFASRPTAPDDPPPKRQQRSFAICLRRIFRRCGNSATGAPSDSLSPALRDKNHGVTASCQISVYCFRAPPLGSGRLSSREAVLPLLYCVKEDGLHWRPTARGLSLPAQMCKCPRSGSANTG